MSALAIAGVNGQWDLPSGGQQNCPPVATRTARSWPPELPGAQLVSGIGMTDVLIVLVGVSAGWVLSVLTPAVTHWLARKRRRRALALLVCPALEQPMLACQAAIEDEGGERPRRPTVPTPTGPQFPTEVDWTAISSELANRILLLPPATARATHELNYIAKFADDEPDWEPWFSHRRKRCRNLLDEASELSSALCKVAGLKASDGPFNNISV